MRLLMVSVDIHRRNITCGSTAVVSALVALVDMRGQEDVGFRRPACKSFCHLDLSPLNGQGRFPEINVMDKYLFIHEILRGWTRIDL